MDLQKTPDDDQKSQSTTSTEIKSVNSSASSNRSKSKHSCSLDTIIKYTSLLILIVQMTSQVILMRYATTRDQPMFLKSVAVFFNELVKLIAALLIFFLTAGSLSNAFQGLKYCYWTNIVDTLKVGVPAFVYTVQNYLLYIGIENLDAGTYMVIYQLKILTTALFTVLILKRKLSILQWIALGILIIGVVIVEYSARKDNSSHTTNIAINSTEFAAPFGNSNFTYTNINDTDNLANLLNGTEPLYTTQHHRAMKSGNSILGFVALLIASFLSGFAGVYFEKILKGSDVSLWLRNVQLASLSLPIGFIVVMANDSRAVYANGLMQGFDWAVWSVVFIQALGGLIVAVVIKYADNILKAFATSIGIILSTVASIFLFALYPKFLFIFGAVLVCIAVFVYGTFSPTPNYTRHQDVESGSKVVR